MEETLQNSIALRIQVRTIKNGLANLFSDYFMPAPYSYELRQKAIASVERLSKVEKNKLVYLPDN